MQIVFGRTDTVRKAVDVAIEMDDEIRRKKCMHHLKPPKRFPVPEDMGSEETATWINWIHLETQALLEDLNKEIRLQNEADDPFTKHIVYAPTSAIQGVTEVHGSQQKTSGKIPLNGYKQQPEEKLASPLPVENKNNPLPQHTRCGEIPPVREVRSKLPTYTARANITR